MNRTVKWIMIIIAMIGYGELRVMSVYAAMFGVIIALSMLIYAALDIRYRPERADQKRSVKHGKRVNDNGSVQQKRM